MNSKKIKKGCGIGLLIIIILIIGFIWMFKSAFGTDNYTVEINQDIGGELICDVTYMADIHSWVYEIDYKYIGENGVIYDFGKGAYDGRYFDEKQQLVKFENWTILETGNNSYSDKIIIFDIENNQKKVFIFEPTEIVKDKLWKGLNLFPNVHSRPAECLVQEINNGVIKVIFEYQRNENELKLVEKQLIEYKIKNETGIPEMINITLIDKKTLANN